MTRLQVALAEGIFLLIVVFFTNLLIQAFFLGRISEETSMISSLLGFAFGFFHSLINQPKGGN